MATVHKRNPAAVARDGAFGIDHTAKLIGSEHKPDPLERQARRVADAFGLTMPHARAVAELAYAAPAGRWS